MEQVQYTDFPITTVKDGLEHGFRVRVVGHFALVQLFGDLEKCKHEEFLDSIQLLLSSQMDVVIDCYFLQGINSKWINLVGFLHQMIVLKTSGKKMLRITHVTSTMISYFSSLPPHIICDSFEKVIKDLEKREFTPEESNVGVLKAFYVMILKTMFITTTHICQRKKIFFKNTTDKKKCMGDYSSLLKGKMLNLHFYMVLSFPSETFSEMIKEILPGEDPDSCLDLISDFVNIIYAQTKIEIGGIDSLKFNEFPLSIGGNYPDVSRPDIEEMNSFDVDKAIILVLPFQTVYGEFFLEIAFPPVYNNHQLEIFFQG